MAKELESRIDHIQERLDDISNSVHSIDKSLALQQSEFIEHTKQDEKMYEQLKRLNDILQVNTDSLREHMHRTDLLEALVTKMDIRLNPIENAKLEDDVIKKYQSEQKKERYERLVRLGKIFGLIATALTILGMLKTFHLI
jgi:DNA repair exonuclease SbcCD ATPase subunit